WPRRGAKASTLSCRGARRCGRDARARGMSEHDRYTDGHLRKVLGSVRTIAMVGASPDWHKASSFAMKYLQSKGYRIIPVNPRAAGKSILGETCYGRLSDIPQSDG